MRNKLFIFFFCISALFCFWQGNAHAQSSNESEPNLNPGIEIRKYALEQSDLDAPIAVTGVLTKEDIKACKLENVNCEISHFTSPETGEVIPLEADIKCDGGEKYLPSGWKTLENQQNKCWKSLKYCFFKGTKKEECYTLDSKHETYEFANLKVSLAPLNGGSSFSLCGSDNSNQYKEYCLWKMGDDGFSDENPVPEEKRLDGDVVGTSSLGISGDTGDDMMRLGPNGKGLIEYVDIGQDEVYGLQYIERTNNNVPKGMMVPLGPKDSYADYKSFLGTNNVVAKNACYPVKATIGCDEEKIVFPKQKCGEATGLNFLFKPINEGETLCQEGSTPVASASFRGENGLGYKWECKSNDE